MCHFLPRGSYRAINAFPVKNLIFALMALLRYIYVFVLAFFLGGWGTPVCNGAIKQTEASRSAGYISDIDSSPFERILEVPLSNVSEVERDPQRSVQKDAREREVSSTLLGSISYAFCARLHHSFYAFVAERPHRFISFATLLVFPKHWFW